MQAFEPFKSGGLPQPDQWRIIVAEEEGAIVGFSCIFAAAHWEPWYLAPSHQRNPAVVRGLLRTGRELLTELGLQGAFVVVSDKEPAVQAMAERLGFKPVGSRLYHAVLDTLKEY